jgi:cysteinyl-tRNA synthetase
MKTLVAIVVAFVTVVSAAGAALPREASPCRKEMRGFVQRLSAWARKKAPGFVVVPQNGEDLLTDDGEGDGVLVKGYVAAINGQGHEELSFGHDADDQPTPQAVKDHVVPLLDRARDAGLVVMTVDYCSGAEHMDAALAAAEARGYLAFAADRRQLDHVPAYPPQPRRSAAGDVKRLKDARNWLYVLDLHELGTRDAALAALRAAPHDVLVIDADHDRTPLTREEVASLRERPDHARRLVIAYLSIGEAERYRPYWKESWDEARPAWLIEENKAWPGNFRVRYADRGWQALVFGNDGSELARIIAAGFDGVWLDRVDAFEACEPPQDPDKED